MRRTLNFLACMWDAMESQEVRSDPEGLDSMNEGMDSMDSMDSMDEGMDEIDEIDEIDGAIGAIGAIGTIGTIGTIGVIGTDGMEGTAFSNDSKMICCSETRDVLRSENTHRRTNSCIKSSRTKRSRFCRECSRGFNRCTVF